jgi:hypothetical protein
MSQAQRARGGHLRSTLTPDQAVVQARTADLKGRSALPSCARLDFGRSFVFYNILALFRRF